MESMIKQMTEEERRAHQHLIIQQWKKDVANAKAELKVKMNTPEYANMLTQLKEANAKRGIIIPGKV